MTTPDIEIKLLHTLAGVKAQEWSQLRDSSFPFNDLLFLMALEEAGCLGHRTGWAPHYLMAYQGETLVGSLILFAKNNSYGEYIFDFNWAEASENSRIPY